MTKSTIAFLGTGLMGAPMARNLLSAGFKLNVWNRTPTKAQALIEHGATVAPSASDAVEGADYVITMLSDGTAVTSLMFQTGVADAIKGDATVMDMSSIKPGEAREHAQRLQKLGLNYLDAPVSGGTKGAEDGSLAIMVGGEHAIFAQAKNVLEALGRPVLVGPVGAGQLAKLANQAIVAVTIGVVAEAMLLAQKGGADPAAIRQALNGGFADSVILQQHGERMTTGDFRPGGPSKFQLKDLNNILEEAGSLGLSLPLAQMMQQRYQRLVHELDCADHDHSAIFLELLAMNG